MAQIQISGIDRGSIVTDSEVKAAVEDFKNIGSHN